MTQPTITRRSFVKSAAALGAACGLGVAVSDDLVHVDPAHADTGGDVKIVKTACRACIASCAVLAHVKNGRVIKIEGNPESPMSQGGLCAKGMAGIQALYHPNRNKYPMRRVGERGQNQWERITWDEAIDAIAEKLNAVLAKDPQAASFYSFTGDLGKLSWEAPTRYAATVGATTWDIEGIMGDHGASMGMTMVFGTHRGAHDSRDYLNSKLLIVWGRNVADTHTSELRDYVAARKNGAKVIVIDPRQCSTAAMADEWNSPSTRKPIRRWPWDDELDHRQRPACERQAGGGIGRPPTSSVRTTARYLRDGGRRGGGHGGGNREGRRGFHRHRSGGAGRSGRRRRHVRDLGRTDGRRGARPRCGLHQGRKRQARADGLVHG